MSLVLEEITFVWVTVALLTQDHSLRFEVFHS